MPKGSSVYIFAESSILIYNTSSLVIAFTHVVLNQLNLFLYLHYYITTQQQNITTTNKSSRKTTKKCQRFELKGVRGKTKRNDNMLPTLELVRSIGCWNCNNWTNNKLNQNYIGGWTDKKFHKHITTVIRTSTFKLKKLFQTNPIYNDGNVRWLCQMLTNLSVSFLAMATHLVSRRHPKQLNIFSSRKIQSKRKD